MSKVRFVGLDVHEQSITIAVAEQGDGAPMVFRRIPYDLQELLKTLRGFIHQDVKLKVAYEAGATGVGIYRKLQAAGIECHMVAPSKVPSNGRQKNDNEDALRLARFLRSGDLRSVYVSNEELESLRTLTRAREDALTLQQAARGQLRNFLVREGHKYPKKSAWTKAYFDWASKLEFSHPAKQIARDDYVREAQNAAARVARLTANIEALVPTSSVANMVENLQALKGVALITAATVAVEVGDWNRFEHPKHFMSFVGLVPREASSGERTQRGSITKAGNAHMRRVLGEAAWHYAHSNVSRDLKTRRSRVGPEVRTIAERAQLRLNSRFRTLGLRGKERNKIATAVARELAGFMWAIAREAEKAKAA